MSGGLKSVLCNSHFSVSVMVLSRLTLQRRDDVKLSRSAAFTLSATLMNYIIQSEHMNLSSFPSLNRKHRQLNGDLGYTKEPRTMQLEMKALNINQHFKPTDTTTSHSNIAHRHANNAANIQIHQSSSKTVQVVPEFK